MKFDEVEVKDGGLWFSKSELEAKFEEYRRLGYLNYNNFSMTGNETLQTRAVEYHAKADVFMYLLQVIIDNEESKQNN